MKLRVRPEDLTPSSSYTGIGGLSPLGFVLPSGGGSTGGVVGGAVEAGTNT